MKYLFFDIECSNCFEGIGKICEFGYVLTDENFNIISKDAIPMSPGKGRNNDFHLKGRKNQKDLELAWDYEFYKAQPEFPHFYDKIKALMSNKDTICFGFDSENDINYLYGTCKRYDLEQFDYICYDVQKFAIKYLENGRNTLKNTYLRLVGKSHIAEFQEHLSRDDAMMTMRIFEALCTLNGSSSDAVLQENSGAGISFEKWIKARNESRHISSSAKNNMANEELVKFRDFVLNLKDLAFANKDNLEPDIVSDKDAYLAKYIVDNVMFEKDGDVFLFLTAMSVLNTYVKQKEHNKAIGYHFKDLLERLLDDSKFTIFKSLKINYIDKELNDNNILIFEFFDNYQFSYHCIRRSQRHKILDEYKCKSTFWGIKNKNCINELFKRVLENKIGFSNLTTINEPLIEKANLFAEEMLKNPNINLNPKRISVNRYTRNGKLKTEGQILWEKFFKECEGLLNDDRYKGKQYTISAKLKESADLTRKVIEKIRNNDFIGIDAFRKSDYIIALDQADKERILNIFKETYLGTILLVKEFLQK